MTFRVSVEEYEIIMKKIAESGLNNQEYILRAVLNTTIQSNAELKELLPELKRVSIELNRQGNNLNQIATVLNQRGYVDYKNILSQTLEAVQDTIEGVKEVWQFKAVSSKSPIKTAIAYVSKEEKTEQKLLSGYNLTSPETAYDEMQTTKEVWSKTDGRTYKHYVQSFAPDEVITPEQAHAIAKEFVESCPQFNGFEVLIATHQDREHIHTHFIINSVSFEDGHKFQQKSTELQEMKDLSDKICLEHGLSLTQKGRTFDGKEREETTAYTKEQYRLLQKAEQGKVKSYVQDIALVVMGCREQA